LLSDNAVSFSDTYTVSNTTVTRPFFGGLTYGTIENLNLNAENGDNTIWVVATAAGTATTINAGAGIDTVNVGFVLFSATLNGIQGPLTVNGQGGTDSVNFLDSGSTVQNFYTYTVGATTVARTGMATVTYGTVEALTLNTTDAADAINVNGTAP